MYHCSAGQWYFCYFPRRQSVLYSLLQSTRDFISDRLIGLSAYHRDNICDIDQAMKIRATVLGYTLTCLYQRMSCYEILIKLTFQGFQGSEVDFSCIFQTALGVACLHLDIINPNIWKMQLYKKIGWFCSRNRFIQQEYFSTFLL